MSALARLLVAVDRVRAPETAHAHCDLPCGVYDPAQARIEADAVTVLGDNSGASTDSRCFGPVDRRELRGRAIYRYWPENRRGRLTR